MSLRVEPCITKFMVGFAYLPKCAFVIEIPMLAFIFIFDSAKERVDE